MDRKLAQAAQDRATAYRRPMSYQPQRTRQQAQHTRQRNQQSRIDLIREKKADLQAYSDKAKRAEPYVDWENDLEALLAEEQCILEEAQQMEVQALQAEQSLLLQNGLSSHWITGTSERTLHSDRSRAANLASALSSVHENYNDDDDWDIGNDTMEYILAAEQSQND